MLPLWTFAEAPFWHNYYQEIFYESKPMKQSNLIFLGDSLTEYYNWQHFGSHHNAGISGDTTGGVLYRIDTILQRKPHTIVLMIGINDLLNDISIEQVQRNYFKILDGLSEVKHLVILSTLPVGDVYQANQINKNVITLNLFLQNEAMKRQLLYIDLHTSFAENYSGIQQQYTIDGVHLNNQGYLLWENILKKEFPSGFSE